MMVGTVVSHYKILERLGSGGMGVVYKAQDLQLDRRVALKFLPPELTRDPEAKQRFVHEAKATSALDHPNICNVHDIGETTDGHLFIVMAYYEGETLKKKIEHGPLKIDESVDIALQLTRGLVVAHEQGIIHRDIKPANVIITPQGVAKLVDFGLAKLAGRTMLTKTGSTLGTAAYMSPEQAIGESVDHRTDIWSLGVVLYELLMGKRPFESDYEQALAYSILNEEPRPIRTARPEVPQTLAQVVQKAMAKKPDERYQTAGELMADLEILKTGEETGRATIASRLAGRRRIRRISLVAGLAVLVVAVVLLVVPMLEENALASNPKTIAFISFENLTGDRNQDPLRLSLQDAIITSLEQSKYFRVTTRERIADILKQMEKKDVEYVDRELGLEICRRDGAEILAVGTFASAGEMYRTSVKLVDVNTLQTVKTFTASGTGVESLLKEQIDELSRQISQGFGISRRQTEATIRPIEDIATTSPLAYQLYLRGLQEGGNWSWAESRRYLEMAVKEDSLFVSAWLELAGACNALGELKDAGRAREKAASLFAKASERQKLQIANFDTTFRPIVMGRPGATEREFLEYRTKRFPKDQGFLGQLGALYNNYGLVDQAIATYSRILELDPDEAGALNMLGYIYAGKKREMDKAIGMQRRHVAILPRHPNSHDSMGDVYFMAHRYDEAVASYLQANALKYDWAVGSYKIAKLYFHREDYEMALRWSDSALARAQVPRDKLRLLWNRAYCMYWLGRLTEAESFLKKAGAILNKLGDQSNMFLEAWIACDRGDLPKCRAYLRHWVRFGVIGWPRTSALFGELCLGYVDLREGKLDSVELRLARMDSIRNSVPIADSSWEGRTLSGTYEGVSWRLRSELLLARGHPEAVFSVVPPEVKTLVFQPLPFNLLKGGWGWDMIGSQSFVHIPMFADGVAKAYAAMGLPDSAIALYERGMDHIGIPQEGVAHEWQMGVVFPRYHYRLAKLYEQTGMRDKAITEYEKFLKIWGKADPVYKEPADARARLTKLLASPQAR